MSEFTEKLRGKNWWNMVKLTFWAFSAIGMSVFVLVCNKFNIALTVSDVVLILAGVPYIKELLNRI